MLFEVQQINEESIKIIAVCKESDDVSKINLDDVQSSLVKKDLEDGKIVTITNGKISATVQEDRKIFKSDNKNLAEYKLKEKYLTLSRNSITSMVFYVDALMQLADKGYFITDQNREEKYIEIIETGDEELIELLEEYLIHKDEITNLKWNRKEYNKGLKTIAKLDEDSEEIREFIRSI